MQATYKILHYLKGTVGKGIMFKRNNELLLGTYMDVDYARSLVERSLLDIIPSLGRNLVT